MGSGASSGGSVYKGARVEVRDNGKNWLLGTVTQVYPLMVQPDGWWSSHQWDQVRQATISSPRAAQKVEAAIMQTALEMAGGDRELAMLLLPTVKEAAVEAIVEIEFRASVKVGTEVECRDKVEQPWRRGVVTETDPVKVKVHGLSRAYEWRDVRAVP